MKNSYKLQAKSGIKYKTNVSRPAPLPFLGEKGGNGELVKGNSS